jgi:hypothetical protein
MAASKPILYINEFASGLYTQRSPLVTPTSTQGLSTIVRYDVLADGQNIELSNNGTLVRRPGLTRYCSVAFGASEYPLNFHTFRNISGTVKTLVDTPTNVRSFTTGALTSVYTKGSSAQTFFKTVANMTYMCNGTDAKKWDGTTVSGWGITAPAVAASIATAAGALSPTSGYRWVYVYRNNSTGHVSTASPESASSGPQTAKNFNLTLTTSADAQVDKIDIYRTVDGGSTYYYLTTINNTGSYTDSSADSALNRFITAPLNHANDPPPAGINNVVFHMGRLWASVDNLVYFGGGPDTLVGVPEETWPPANVFKFPGKVTAMVSTSAGLLVFTNADAYIIRGSDSSSFYSQLWQANFGVASQNCVASDGDLVFLYTSVRQLFSISNVLDEIGFAIGDQLLANFDPASTYLTIHRSGSDSGLFVSNGTDTVFRYNIAKDAWSPKATYSSVKCVKSISVADGDYRLLLGKATASSYIFYRDLTTWQDDSASFSAYATVGTIVVAPLGRTAPVLAALIERTAAGTDMTVSALLNEISGSFTTLANPVNEPTRLAASSTVVAKRHYLKGAASPLPEQIRHLQVKIAFASENAKNELLGFALLPPSLPPE